MMRQMDRDMPASGTKPMVLIAMMVCLAMVLSYIERFIPLSFSVPGIKLGLANLVILTGLYLFSWRQVLTLVVLKCIMTAWMFGSFSAFLYSVSGSLLSFAVMSLMLYGIRHKLNTVWISAAGAIFHNLGQLLMATFILQNFKVMYYMPVLLVAGVVTGIVIGLGVQNILPYVVREK